MINNYVKRGALMFGAAALLSVSAMADSEWRNINHKVSNPAWLPGWSGCLTDAREGVGEAYNGAFNLYQVLPDMPAGEYTLTMNGFIRTADAWIAYDEYKAGQKGDAYIYLNDAKAPLANLFDHPNASDETLIGPDGYVWGIVPNDLAVANLEFAAGNYQNKVTVNHAGGDLLLGICNPTWALYEWTAFDNFKLTGPQGDVVIPNGDFSEGTGAGNWDTTNIDGGDKLPDMNRGGGTFRKSNASPYNIGQTLTDMPAGTYRFSVLSFFRHGNGNTEGGFYPIKGAYEWTEGTSAYDLHVAGQENEENHPYIYIYNNTYPDLHKETVKDFFSEDGIEYHETAIKCLFDLEKEYWVDNVPTPEFADRWADSGFEYESSAAFVNHPEVYLNTVEITLTEPGNITFGIKKDTNVPAQYWHPWTDMKLEYTNSAGVKGISVDNSNAPVEYYNLQGLRVAEPTEGIYIVKQGTEVRKQVIRK